MCLFFFLPKEDNSFLNKTVSVLLPIIKQLTPAWIQQHHNHERIEGKDNLFLCLYALLSSERKTAWHQRIASVLVKYGRKQVSEFSAQIAHHLLHGLIAHHELLVTVYETVVFGRQ